ncbi:YhcH/YjgK/YiaL family protein [Tenuifilum thalassicum]|uniref:DUF386 domain-containing protein n=1 Tax=Tenuifilum thalassicum TaxID=2590900 RepID=A0A7D3XEJ4_9BACT|nr:YhcH/YjgK/YiaL family protein [Tenuifilum thalassicum]QKG80292.1 DUF386 domain-containing protein [Tenuifilum thalassicum]
MIVAPLTDFGTYLKLHPLFERVEQALITLDFSNPGEKIYIENDKLIAIPSFNKGRNTGEALLESHDRYIDIQICLQGEETFGWADRQTCSSIVKPYNQEKDITFYNDEPSTYFTLKPNQFAIFFPNDCHAPLIGSGLIKKVVFKVKVESNLHNF